MIDLGIGIKDKKLFFGVELDSIEWVLVTFHRCYKDFSIVIIAHTSGSKYVSKAGIVLEFVRSDAIMMMIVSKVEIR